MAQLRPQAPRTAVELCRRLHELFPAFGGDVAGAYFVMANAFTPHAVCSAFTSTYLNRVHDYGAPEIRDLFAMVEVIVAADRLHTDPLANALCTCFLENISSTEAGERSARFMGPHSRRFFDGWHTWPLPTR